MIQIEKGVAIPKNTNSGRKRIYPLDEMSVGDSFYVACDENNLDKISRSVRNTAINYTKRDTSAVGKKFTVRNVEGGVRCWRIS
jgi:hypothetical protein